MRLGIYPATKTFLVLPAKIWFGNVGAEQAVPADGKAAQPRAGWRGRGCGKIECGAWLSFSFTHAQPVNQPIAEYFQKIGEEFNELQKFNPDISNHPGLMKGTSFFSGRIADWASALRHAGKKQCRILPSFYKTAHHTCPQPCTGRQF